MKTPERLSSLRAARQKIRFRDQKIARMKKRQASSKGVEDVSKEIEEVHVKERAKEIPKSNFRRVFWDQHTCTFFCSMYW